tara:strand:- start:3675 stop:3977 length:303 start_codon:yes stop_codon:yes gene_type:complete
MTKKGPLGKAELFYVKEHCQTLDAKEIAKELDRPIATVRKAADKFLAEFPKDQRLGTAGAQMARRDGVVTMTAGASQTADSKRSTGKKARPDCVTTIQKG